jgi:hypothetical protein
VKKTPKINKDNPKLQGGTVKGSNAERSVSPGEKKVVKPKTNP